MAKVLREKITYASRRWGATLFYIDSNCSLLRPDELWQIRRVAREFPEVLLIPEHYSPLYSAVGAPYVAPRKGDDPTVSEKWLRRFVSGLFQAGDIGDWPLDGVKLAAAQSRGDILLFCAWFSSPEVELLEHSAKEREPLQR